MKVSEIMDNYTDNEFLIEGESDTSTDEVLKGVMGRIKAEKKPLRLKTKIIIIAAAVAVSGVIMGASLPGGFMISKTGEEITFDVDGMIGGSYGEDIAPYTVEEDKVFLTVDNQHVDITDTINSGENYYYYFTVYDSQAQEHKGIICVGGTMDDLGYGESIYTVDGSYVTNMRYNISAPYEKEKEWVLEFDKKVEEYRKQIFEEYQAKMEENGIALEENQTETEEKELTSNE